VRQVPLNTNQKDERTQAEHKAAMALLERIASTEAPTVAIAFAEAYAWITSPGQPHGGRSA